MSRFATSLCLAALLAVSWPVPAVQGQAAANQGGAARGGVNNVPRSWEWWNDADVRRELNLSPDKVRKIQGIYASRSQELKPTIDEFIREQAALDALTRARTVDEVSYTAQVAKVQFLGSKIGESRTVMLYRMYLVLSPDQYRKLQDIRDRRMRDRERGPESK